MVTRASRPTRTRTQAGTTTTNLRIKDSGQPFELDPATVRKHLAGWITIGLYAINSQSQRCKWIAIDADYDRAFFDLGKMKGELDLDGCVSPKRRTPAK